HGMMQVTGIDGEDHTWDLVGAGFGLAADLGYVGTVAGFVTNGSVAVVRIAFKLISKIDNGHTIRLILGHGDDVLKSVKRLIYYAMKHGDPYLQGLLDRLRTNPASVSAGEIAAASALFISKQSDRIVNSYRRMKHCRAVQVMGSMVDASGAPLMIRTYEEGVLAVNKAVFDRVKRVALTPRGAEGWYIVARMNNVPDADNVASALRGTLDAANNPAADELADAALENVGLACAKTADDFSPGHARAVQNAAHNAVRAYDSNLRGLVLGHIGLNPDGTKRAFATMAEFEALRVLPVDNLNDVQRLAIHAIRAGVIKPLAGARVTKVVPLSSRFLPGPHGPTEIPGAMSYLQNGHAGFGGYFMRQTDIPAPPASVMNRIRNDYDGSPLMPTDGYAVMETNLTQAMADTTRTPVNSVPPGGLASEYVQVTDGLPCTGNGFAGSVDGHLTSE
ncbi:MAG: hypothetical protein Q8L55_00615, partial [Phycisphaerales bacterium]|nr:hypothetical protein [Phycisphaerales bacterium]